MYSPTETLILQILFIGYTDGCPEDNTTLGERNLTIRWPETDIGMVTVPCPCGNVAGIINQNARKIRNYRFGIFNFDAELEWCKFRALTEYCKQSASPPESFLLEH